MTTLGRRVTAITSAFAAALAGSLLAAPAQALPALACGDTVTVNTTLTADLVCDGTTDGLIIGASGITLDLKGHTISGPGAYQTAYAGVRVAGQHDVVVTRGTVTGWQAGVVLDEAWRVTVSKISAVADDQGINVAGGGDHRILQSTISQNGRDGVRLGLSTRTAVSQNVLDGNTWGITVASNASSNTISKNDVRNSHQNGIAVFDGSADTVLSQNTVTGSWGDGVAVAADTTGSVLSQNKSTSNGGDGFDVTNVTLVKNTAVSNAGHGIIAASSVDGNGNKAGSNATEPQCVGVACKAP